MTVWRKLSDLVAATGSGGARALRILFGDGLPALQSDASAPEHTVAFTTAVIALGAKMAKADGVVVALEVEAFHRVFRVEGGQAATVERLFNLAQQDVAGYEAYADKVRGALHDDRKLLADVLDALFHIATADRALHPGEDAFLRTVATRFGFSESEYRHIRARFVVDPTSPYDVLGIEPGASDAAVKARHRALVKETHPDHLIARGVPQELIDVATRKLQAINAAYAAIARDRGL
jgi:DnaJ like chaperone protein